MKKTATGAVADTQPRIKHPDYLTERDEILSIQNSLRTMAGKKVLTEDEIEEQKKTISPNAQSRITKTGVEAYAKLII